MVVAVIPIFQVNKLRQRDSVARPKLQVQEVVEPQFESRHSDSGVQQTLKALKQDRGRSAFCYLPSRPGLILIFNVCYVVVQNVFWSSLCYSKTSESTRVVHRCFQKSNTQLQQCQYGAEDGQVWCRTCVSLYDLDIVIHGYPYSAWTWIKCQ